MYVNLSVVSRSESVSVICDGRIVVGYSLISENCSLTSKSTLLPVADMDITECGICFLQYESPLRIPKNTGCGHNFCLQCLKDEKLQHNRLVCPTCRTAIFREPDALETNYSILREAEDVTAPRDIYFCLMCRKKADPECKKKHSVRDMEAYRAQQTEGCRKAVQAATSVLEKVVPRMLHVKDVVEDQLTQVMSQQDEMDSLTRRFRALANGVGGGEAAQARWDEAMRAGGECSTKLPGLQRGLSMLELESGLCRLEFQGTGSAATWTASLDLAKAAKEHPQVLATAQFLIYLLGEKGYLQSQPKRANPHASAAGEGDARPNARQPATPRQPGFLGSNNQNNNKPQEPEVVDGVLDLTKDRVGEATPGQMAQQKGALLRSQQKVSEIRGMKCSADPSFCEKLIRKHGPHLVALDLQQVKPEHFSLLYTLPQLQHLKIVNCDGRLPRIPVQPGSVLVSLYMGLPYQVQLGLWEAYASSVSRVVIRLRIQECVDPHLSIRKVAVKTPNLRTLHLHRTNADQHTREECERQVAAIRGELPPAVRVTCNMCLSESKS